MKVSVIMAVYNNEDEEILSSSIDSILNQTFSDLELIICDDASTDLTYELLCKLSKKDNRIKLIKNEINQKAGISRNKCAEIAKGEFIAIMDSDDISHPNRIENQIRFLESNNKFAFVGTRGSRFLRMPGDLNDDYWYIEEPKNTDFLFTLPFVHGSIMFRVEKFREIGGYSYDERVERSEDYEMLMRMYVKGYKGYNLNESLYFIREDKNTFKRRMYRYRMNEVFVKFNGFKNLGLMPKAILFVIKPLIIGLIPNRILYVFKKIYYKEYR